MALQDHPMWRPPMHHESLQEPHNHVHWVELFYDLIHVVCVFLLGNYLSHHLSVEGFLVFTGIFVVIWMSWAESSYFNSLYVSTDIYHRAIMTAQICTVMIAASAIPAIPGKGEAYFAVAYALNRAITAYMYRRAIRHNRGTHGLAYEMSRNFFIAAGLIFVAAFLPRPFNYALLAVAVIGIQFSFLHEKWGVMRFERFTPRLAHLSERFALLFLIVMGEGFFKLVVALSEKGVYKVGPEILFNFVLGGATVFALTWMYFDFVGNARPRQTSKWLMASWWYGHLTLMLSAIMIGVALKAQVKIGFMDLYPLKYAALGCSGVVLFLASLAVIQNVVEPRFAHRHAKPSLRFFGMGMAALTLLVVQYIPSILSNTMFAIAVFSQIIIPIASSVREIRAEDAS